MKKTLLDCVSSFEERRYRAVWNCLGETEIEEFGFDLEIEVDQVDYEWKYSLMEHADEILKLSVNQSIYYRGNRDDNSQKGFIVRIK